MDKLAWIELTDRQGHVIHRQPLTHWPVCIGRSYNCDVIVDDEYVAPEHLEITGLEGGMLSLRDRGSRNGTQASGRTYRNESFALPADTVIRIGHTALKIRPPSPAVAEERPLSTLPWRRRKTTLAGSIGLFLLVTGLQLLPEYFSPAFLDGILSIFFLGLAAVVGWIMAWALIGLLATGKSNVIAHANTGFIGVSLFWSGDVLISTIGFSFNLAYSDLPITFFRGLVMTGMLYHHLRLISRASVQRTAMLSATLAGLVMSGDVLYGNMQAENDFSTLHYDDFLQPPFMLLDKGISIDEFVSAASRREQE